MLKIDFIYSLITHVFDQKVISTNKIKFILFFFCLKSSNYFFCMCMQIFVTCWSGSWMFLSVDFIEYTWTCFKSKTQPQLYVVYIYMTMCTLSINGCHAQRTRNETSFNIKSEQKDIWKDIVNYDIKQNKNTTKHQDLTQEGSTLHLS